MISPFSCCANSMVASNLGTPSGAANTSTGCRGRLDTRRALTLAIQTDLAIERLPACSWLPTNRRIIGTRNMATGGGNIAQQSFGNASIWRIFLPCACVPSQPVEQRPAAVTQADNWGTGPGNPGYRGCQNGMPCQLTCQLMTSYSS